MNTNVKRTFLCKFLAAMVAAMFLIRGVPVQAGEGWHSSGDCWYYILSSGEKAEGWKEIGSKWYYFDDWGIMATDWKLINNKWYYFDASGAMATDWKLLGNKWYYFDASGAMATDWKLLGGKWYYFDASGAMTTDWKLLGGKWYYFDASGAMATDWKLLGGKWYYFDASGRMYSSEWVNGIYYMSSSGEMMVNTWTEDGYWVDEHGVFSYISIVYSSQGCQIPYINISSSQIKALNQRIYNTYYNYINGYNEFGEYCYSTKFVTGIKNGIFSLMITSQHSPGGNTVMNIYNVDLSSRTEASTQQVINASGFTPSAITSMVRNAVAKQYKNQFTGFNFSQTMYENTLSPENLSNARLFINDKQHLSAVVKAYIPAGAGETLLNVDLEG